MDKDVIISDGLVSVSNVFFSRNAALDFKDLYLNVKSCGNIIKSL